MFKYINIKQEDRAVMETEIRFQIATATVEALELLTLAINSEDEIQTKKCAGQIKRILSQLKKEGRVSFFIEHCNLNNGSTESEFLKNKYSSHLFANANDTVFFVKI